MRTNAGYRIIKSEEYAPDCEIVMGFSQTKASAFVTWNCYNKSHYYHGHYISTREKAEYDYHMRLMELYNYEYDLGY